MPALILSSRSFFNYVDQILPIIDHLPRVDIGKEISSLLQRKICKLLTFPVTPTLRSLLKDLVILGF